MANQYIFLPWLRRGLAKQIAEADPLTGSPATATRAQINLNVQILADDAVVKTVPQEVTLVGPGDVIGIDSSAIVKTEPAAGVNNFEPNFFPYIEFYEEDFPWRYTPAKASGDRRLRPWIALIVLKESEFDRIQNSSARGTTCIRIAPELIPAVLPLPEQSWAWAHVHINENTVVENELSDTNIRNQKIAGILNDNPNLGVSRLMCPRKLNINTKYFAFVVPAFEQGRQAGLGSSKAAIEAINRFVSSWGGQHDSALELPVYYEWNFQTGTEDFEALAKKITPRDLTGTDVGKLWMDASDINYGDSFDYKGNPEPDNPERLGFLPFEGALRLPESPSAPPTPPLTLRTGPQDKDFVTRFAGLINLGVQYRHKMNSELQWAIAIPGNGEDDPLLVPPVYGKWYANADGEALVDPSRTSNWLEQLNLDPAYRVAAGLGAEVVREYQEEYVSRAWDQLSDYRKNLNTQLGRLRFAQEITNAAYQKHFAQVGAQVSDPTKILALTQSLHSMVKSDDPNLSIAAKLTAYKTETAFTQPAYRRITRTSGPVMKRVKVKTAYQSVVMSGAIEFAVMAFVLNPSPPFQNFNCSDKLMKIHPADFTSSSIMIGFPDWFSNNMGTFRVSVDKWRVMFEDLQATVLRKPILLKPAQPNINILTDKIQMKIIPASSFAMLYQSMIPEASPAPVTGSDVISPNSFNPFYTDPTYERLGKLKPELFIPNLDQVKPESFVLLQAHSAFIEAFLTGMNHELASEFLWRGYPADMNATFFRQFWDKSDSAPSNEDKSDIQYIRQWKPASNLGKNGPPGSFPNPLVFVIKAELVRKYPNLVVYAQKAVMTNNNRNRIPDAAQQPLSPIFLSDLSPDFLFAGFELSPKDARGSSDGTDPGYYFVIAERPGEVHFGLDQSRKNGYNTWNDLAWTDIAGVVDHIDLQKDIPPDLPQEAKKGMEWGKGEKTITTDPAAGTGDAAQMAGILNQKPVRIFVHASMLIHESNV